MTRSIALLLVSLCAHSSFAIDISARPAEPVQTGMTWGASPAAAPAGVVLVGCHGLPKTAGGSCDAYIGDTACSTALPVLCVNIDHRTKPARLHTGFYAGWLGGEIALAPPVRGDIFADRSAADAWCSDHFGARWRMGEHHDRSSGAGGWAFYGIGAGIGEKLGPTRFWTAINDTGANCWNKKSPTVNVGVDYTPRD